MTDMLHCEDAAEYVSALADGETIPSSFAQHIGACTACQARLHHYLAMGAELGFTQAGNNNAYAQDNAGSWIDWLHADHDLIDFTRRLIAQRHAHRALRDDRFLAGTAVDGRGVADIEWRGAEGALIEAADWEKSNSDTLVAAFYAGADESVSDRVAIAIHRGRNDIRVALPNARAGFVWRRCLDTAKAAVAVMTAETGSAAVSARSVVTFVETADDRKSKNSHADDEILNRLAQTAGIAADWWDVAGTRHTVSPETKRTLLAAMNLRAETVAQTRESLARIMQTRQHRLLPMVRVIREGALVDLRVTLPAAQSPPRGGATVRNEAGEVMAQIATADLATQILTDPFGRRLRVSALSLPQLDVGRYQVSFDALPDTICRLTITPRLCFRPPLLDTDQRTARSFGFSVQAYSLRRANANDSGVGDFSAIGEFALHAARAGAATVGINPLHMLFPADRERVSPYHPSDRRFIDPIYLDPGTLYDLPGFTEAGLQWQQNRFRMHLAARDDIEYSAVWALKNTALQALFTSMQRAMRDQADSSIVHEFADFVRTGGESLRLFATFQVITEMHANGAWTTWPNALRSAHRIEVEAFAAQHAGRVRYHEFLQWLCERQLAATALRARDNGLTLGLYRDLAVGAAPDGAESWANATQLARDVAIGAPPDPLAPGGQVWNLPPPNPLAWPEHDYASFRQALAANMRHAGILRIDHVLGLARLFWVPAGGKAIDGAYVAYPTEDLLGHLALESQRQQCAVIGEDLGTVPDGLREKLADNGMLRYQVMLLEREGNAFKSPAGYSANAAACASTHDLPPLAGWWQAADIRERESLGLIAGAETTPLLSVRREEKRLLVDAVNATGISLQIDLDAPLHAEAMAALHAWLARAPSTLLLAQAEDLAFETVGQNLPGTDRERPNWRRRLAATSEELFTSESVQRVLQALRR